jgi:hypothetical protein
MLEEKKSSGRISKIFSEYIALDVSLDIWISKRNKTLGTFSSSSIGGPLVPVLFFKLMILEPIPRRLCQNAGPCWAGNNCLPQITNPWYSWKCDV